MGTTKNKGIGQGKGGGKPLKWETPEKLQEEINAFYIWCDKNGKKKTVSRLAWWLDTNRQTLLNYQNANEFSWLSRCNDEDRKRYVDAVKKAKSFIESEYEEALMDKSSTVGAIFTLKNNYSWVDKKEVVNTNNDINISLEE